MSIATASTPPAIESRDLTRKYGRVTAIQSLNVAIEAGEKVVLVGPNGSGKTTLIKLLATLIKPTSGTLFIHGHDSARHDAAIRAAIGVVLHEPLLYNRLTAAENLRFYARMFRVPEPEARIEALAEQLGVTELLRNRVDSLSHGQRKRVSTLRAVLHDPSILLLDEPDSGLDSGALQRLFDFCKSHDKTIVMSTHNLDNGLQIADRALILKRGRVVSDSGVETLDREVLDIRYEALAVG
jgi:heme exporter protein A